MIYVHPSPMRRAGRAFTLIELLVVVAIIAALIAILLPSMNEARETAKMAVCGSNHKQLMTAWTAYAATNKQALVGSHPQDEHGWVDDGAGAQPIRDGVLYPYLNSVDVFRCPSENRDYRVDAAGGPITPMPLYERSYSISAFMSDAAATWSAKRYTSVPHASSAMVYLDEADPRSYNLGSWVTGMGSNWTDFPATWHMVGVNISFADGHAEFYRHQDPFTSQITWFHQPAPGSPDLKYFQRIFRPDLQ